MTAPKYSIIVPVYNRPAELRELLHSLVSQTRNDFEVIVVDDGSTVSCESVAQEYSKQLQITYLHKPNSGPGPSRNVGYAQARGEYLVVFDSDCILPPTYFEAVDAHMRKERIDAWGGPDRAHERFSERQRAMAYTMSAFLTTGGIRGGKKRLGWFQPRSFNMGISKEVFKATGGFQLDRFAEDIEFSVRMKKAGFRVALISEAFVYHKRRATFSQFFQQVYNFGKGRALVGVLHPEEVKLTHWFPALFTIATLGLPVLYLFSDALATVGLSVFALYLSLIFLDSLLASRHIGVAALSVVAALLQLWGYGIGFIVQKVAGKGK